MADNSTDAQSASELFQGYYTGKLTPSDIHKECNRYMTILKEELSKTRKTYFENRLRIYVWKLSPPVNHLSIENVAIELLVEQEGLPFPWTISLLTLGVRYDENKNIFEYISRTDVGFRIGKDNISEGAFEYLTQSRNFEVNALGGIGIYLGELQSYIEYGHKNQRSLGRGFRDIVIEKAKHIPKNSLPHAILNYTVGPLIYWFWKRASRQPL